MEPGLISRLEALAQEQPWPSEPEFRQGQLLSGASLWKNGRRMGMLVQERRLTQAAWLLQHSGQSDIIAATVTTGTFFSRFDKILKSGPQR